MVAINNFPVKLPNSRSSSSCPSNSVIILSSIDWGDSSVIMTAMLEAVKLFSSVCSTTSTRLTTGGVGGWPMVNIQSAGYKNEKPSSWPYCCHSFWDSGVGAGAVGARKFRSPPVLAAKPTSIMRSIPVTIINILFLFI